MYSAIPESNSKSFSIIFILCHISDRRRKNAPKAYFTLDLSHSSSIVSISSSVSVISGRIGSIFTTQHTPASENFLMTLKIDDEGGVPGSTTRLIFSLHVVIDHTKKQLFLYF